MSDVIIRSMHSIKIVENMYGLRQMAMRTIERHKWHMHVFAHSTVYNDRVVFDDTIYRF